MARSSPQPDDPVSRTGLEAGMLCWLEYHQGGKLEAATSQVQNVGPARLALAPPQVDFKPVELAAGLGVTVFFASRHGYFRFSSQVIGPSMDGRHLFIKRPADIIAGDRRRAFRLDVAITPLELFPLVVPPAGGEPPPPKLATVVDLSEGGLCLSTRASYPAGERLGIRMELPGTGMLTARMTVRFSESPRPGMRNYRVHCQFVNLDAPAAKTIQQFLLRRQRELRARGQL